jgi:hypothetical protein
MVCLGNICINTVHKGAEDDDDNNNNNNRDVSDGRDMLHAWGMMSNKLLIAAALTS